MTLGFLVMSGCLEPAFATNELALWQEPEPATRGQLTITVVVDPVSLEEAARYERQVRESLPSNVRIGVKMGPSFAPKEMPR